MPRIRAATPGGLLLFLLLLAAGHGFSFTVDAKSLVSTTGPPAGSLVALEGPGGCVAQADDPVGHPQHLPAADGCAAGWVFQQLHHVTLSHDERFVYTVSGVPGHKNGDESAIGIFSRDAKTGRVRQLKGRLSCVERANPPRDIGCSVARNLHGLRFVTISPDDRYLYTTEAEGITPRYGQQGCARGRGILGAHAVILGRDERIPYLASDREAGIAVFRRSPTTGALTQLQGAYGCLSGIPREGCTVSRRMGGVHNLVLSWDGRFIYAAGENSEALVVLRVVGS